MAEGAARSATIAIKIVGDALKTIQEISKEYKALSKLAEKPINIQVNVDDAINKIETLSSKIAELSKTPVKIGAQVEIPEQAAMPSRGASIGVSVTQDAVNTLKEISKEYSMLLKLAERPVHLKIDVDGKSADEIRNLRKEIDGLKSKTINIRQEVETVEKKPPIAIRAIKAVGGLILPGKKPVRRVRRRRSTAQRALSATGRGALAVGRLADRGALEIGKLTGRAGLAAGGWAGSMASEVIKEDARWIVDIAQRVRGTKTTTKPSEVVKETEAETTPKKRRTRRKSAASESAGVDLPVDASTAEKALSVLKELNREYRTLALNAREAVVINIETHLAHKASGGAEILAGKEGLPGEKPSGEEGRKKPWWMLRGATAETPSGAPAEEFNPSLLWQLTGIETLPKPIITPGAIGAAAGAFGGILGAFVGRNNEVPKVLSNLRDSIKQTMLGYMTFGKAIRDTTNAQRELVTEMKNTSGSDTAQREADQTAEKTKNLKNQTTGLIGSLQQERSAFARLFTFMAAFATVTKFSDIALDYDQLNRELEAYAERMQWNVDATMAFARAGSQIPGISRAEHAAVAFALKDLVPDEKELAEFTTTVEKGFYKYRAQLEKAGVTSASQFAQMVASGQASGVLQDVLGISDFSKALTSVPALESSFQAYIKKNSIVTPEAISRAREMFVVVNLLNEQVKDFEPPPTARWEDLYAAIKDIALVIGTILLPGLMIVADIVRMIANFIMEHKIVANILAFATALIVASTAAFLLASAIALVQTSFALLFANPVMLAIAFAAVVVYLVYQMGIFHKIVGAVTGAWEALVGAISWVLSPVTNLISQMGILKTITDALAKPFEVVHNIVSAILDKIGGVIGGISQFIGSVSGTTGGGSKPAGVRTFASGTLFESGGLFAGIVHAGEEIIPEAVARKGAGPIGSMLAMLQKISPMAMSSVTSPLSSTNEILKILKYMYYEIFETRQANVIIRDAVKKLYDIIRPMISTLTGFIKGASDALGITYATKKARFESEAYARLKALGYKPSDVEFLPYGYSTDQGYVPAGWYQRGRMFTPDNVILNLENEPRLMKLYQEYQRAPGGILGALDKLRINIPGLDDLVNSLKGLTGTLGKWIDKFEEWIESIRGWIPGWGSGTEEEHEGGAEEGTNPHGSYQSGAWVKRSGRISAVLHSPEEIIPKAIAEKGPGPISIAIQKLEETVQGRNLSRINEDEQIRRAIEGYGSSNQPVINNYNIIEINNPHIDRPERVHDLSSQIKFDLQKMIRDEIRREARFYMRF